MVLMGAKELISGMLDMPNCTSKVLSGLKEIFANNF